MLPVCAFQLRFSPHCCKFPMPGPSCFGQSWAVHERLYHRSYPPFGAGAVHLGLVVGEQAALQSGADLYGASRGWLRNRVPVCSGTSAPTDLSSNAKIVKRQGSSESSDNVEPQLLAGRHASEQV